MFFPVSLLGEPISEFFVYDKGSDRRVITGSTNGQTWTSYADRLAASNTARHQWAWMRNRQRAGVISFVANNPFEYTNDKNQSTWNSSDVHADADTINTLIYRPSTDRLVAIYPGSGVKENAWYSDDGGATWNVGTQYDTADLGNPLSWGSWGESQGKFVFVKATTGNGFATIGYHSSTGNGWTRVDDIFGGITSCHVNAVRYSSTYNQYMAVCNGTAILNVYPRRFFYSTTGTSFSSVVISADDVGWTDCIEVNGVTIAVAGKDNSADHKSNLCARSTDGGANWSVSASMPASRKWAWLAYNGSVVACVPENAAKVAVTTDLALTWNEYDLPWAPTDARLGAFYSMPT